MKELCFEFDGIDVWMSRCIFLWIIGFECQHSANNNLDICGWGGIEAVQRSIAFLHAVSIFLVMGKHANELRSLTNRNCFGNFLCIPQIYFHLRSDACFWQNFHNKSVHESWNLVLDDRRFWICNGGAENIWRIDCCFLHALDTDDPSKHINILHSSKNKDIHHSDCPHQYHPPFW